MDLPEGLWTYGKLTEKNYCSLQAPSIFAGDRSNVNIDYIKN